MLPSIASDLRWITAKSGFVSVVRFGESYFNVLILRDDYYIHYNFVQQFDILLQKMRKRREDISNGFVFVRVVVSVYIFKLPMVKKEEI